MEGVAHTVWSNAVQLLAAEYVQLSGVGGEVAELRDDVATMTALLRMQSEAEDGAVDHFVREWMKQLRELAYDSEDCIDMYRLRIKCRPGDGVRARFRHLLRTLFSRRRLAGEIRALRARASAISERHARYGVNREALRRFPALSAAPVSVPAQGLSLGNDGASHRQVIGLEDQVETLAMRLKASAEAEGHLKVFSIVGFGGVGKTTLAMEVCRLLEADFPYKAFVSVSQAFDPCRDLKALLKRVLEQIVKTKVANEKGIIEEGSLGNLDSLDSRQLAKEPEERLENKRYLIVIDDAWTTRAWEAIQSVFPENNCNSRIIVTTRMETVAKACSSSSVGADFIYHMQPLRLEDSKRLLVSRVFGSAIATYPMELEEVMSSILKKCSGLPLAIVSIASVLAGYKSPGNIDKWETICKSIGSQMESNPTLEGMRQIVTLSFNYLPLELKGCMMFFSIFPEDYAIKKDRLLCRWIAEGLVSEKRGLTMMEVAESYLDELLSRSMIEDRSNLLDSYIQLYGVHDMLLEVMVSKSLEDNFVSLEAGSYHGLSYDRIRRLSIHGSVNMPYSPPKRTTDGHRGTKEVNMQHVRSLSIFHLEEHKLLDQLGKFTLLRVLDLEGCEGVTNKHVRYACQLHLLKFLSLKDTNVSRVPPEVQNLEHLQTLDVRFTLLDDLPETVTKLERLESLLLCNKDKESKWILPKGLSKMKALRELRLVCLGNDANIAQELGELELLQGLDLWIGTKCMDVLQQLALSLSKRNSLRHLGIISKHDPDVLNFLHDLPAPPRLLRVLSIWGVINGLPSWIGSLSYLTQFNIISCRSLDVDHLFGVLYRLPNLKFLRVWLDANTNDEVVARTSKKFPVLGHFRFSGHLPKVIRFEEGSMDMLETLILRVHSHESETSIIGMEHLTNLKKVMIQGYKDSPSTNCVLGQLKDWNDRLPKQLQVVVKYID
ncbi:hypothetical protein EJB05_30601, partial [Eragrostis curvula]